MSLPGPKPVVEPHKELRFTRSPQASLFAVLGAMCAGASAAFAALVLIPKDPLLPWWFAVLPLPVAALLFRLAFRCARHAYLILTPLGIEIFPFFGARDNLQVLYWSEIAEAEIRDGNQLVIHLNKDRSAGVVASLAPLAARQRALLEHAVHGRMAEEQAELTPSPESSDGGASGTPPSPQAQ